MDNLCKKFSVTQILREINRGDFKSSEVVILTILESLNFCLGELTSFFKEEIFLKSKFRASKNFKMTVFGTLSLLKEFISRILCAVTENLLF